MKAMTDRYANMINDGGPERIWIESDGGCPYFYPEEELSDVAPPITEYVRADKLEELAAEIEALRAEVERLRDLCDDLYSDLLAAGSLAPRDCGAYALIQETIKLRRDRWARKQAPNA